MTTIATKRVIARGMADVVTDAARAHMMAAPTMTIDTAVMTDRDLGKKGPIEGAVAWTTTGMDTMMGKGGSHVTGMMTSGAEGDELHTLPTDATMVEGHLREAATSLPTHSHPHTAQLELQ